jgi:tRNA nucleotidyltransferase (CCA-adding enzyme)
MRASIQVGEAKVICKILHSNRKQAFIVGGAVRDLMIGAIPHDADVATDARPEEVTEILTSNGYDVIPIGEEFGTVAVKDRMMKKPIEVTTFRSEGRYTDKRHPDKIKFERDLFKDLERRDFTINAMAIDVRPNKQNPMQQGIILDPFNGKQDLEDHLIRAVGDAEERFQEDPLRMLRMCRFASKMGFAIEAKTMEAAKKFNHLIKMIPAERVKDELFKLLGCFNPYIGLNLMMKSGLMKQILPEVADIDGMPQPTKHHKYTAMYHTFMTVGAISEEDVLLRFAALLHDIGKNKANQNPNPPPYYPAHDKAGADMLPAIFERLKLSNNEQKYVDFIVRNHMATFSFRHEFTTKSIRRWLSKHSDNIDLIPDLITHVRADIIGSGVEQDRNFSDVDAFEKIVKEVLTAKEPFSLRDLAINGNDLLAIGVPADETMTKILNKLLEEVVENPELNTKNYLLESATNLQQLYAHEKMM